MKSFLPVDDPFVAVFHGFGLEGCQVGAGGGFGIADGEMNLASEDFRQEAVFLLLGAELADGGGRRCWW